MKKIYQKYKDWFVIVLFGLFCLKSCQSCSRSRTIEFADHKHSIEIENLKQENAMIIDSLENHIDTLDYRVNSLYNENQLYISQINALESTIELYKEENKDLKDNNKHYRNTNRVLVNTNNQIINKEN